jgi:hypothetical protein
MLISHIFQALEIYTGCKEHAGLLYNSGTMAMSKKVLLDGNFENRKLASFVLLDFCRVAETDWILALGEDLLDGLVAAVQSYVPNDVCFFLECVLGLIDRDDELLGCIIGNSSLRELIERLDAEENENGKISELVGIMVECLYLK